MSAVHIVTVVFLCGICADVARAREAEPAKEAAPSVVPTVGLSLGVLSERARLETFGAVHKATRSDLRASLALGLAHPVWSFGEPGAAHLVLDGHSSVSLGPTLDGGRWQLPVREDVTLAWAAASWLTLRAGLGAGFVLDATRLSSSFVELAVPLSLELWGTVELVGRPALAFGVAEEERSVFGGTQAIGPGVALVPLDFTLRFRLPALGF
jgi:hypothetical protein